MQKRKTRKELAKEQISFRCTKRQKNWIQRSAAKKGVNQKEFIMNSIQNYMDEGKKKDRKELNQAACACEVQALVNHLNRKHKNDNHIEEVCKRLWDLLN